MKDRVIAELKELEIECNILAWEDDRQNRQDIWFAYTFNTKKTKLDNTNSLSEDEYDDLTGFHSDEEDNVIEAVSCIVDRYMSLGLATTAERGQNKQCAD